MKKYFIVNNVTGEKTEVEYRGAIESRSDDALFFPVGFEGNEDGTFTEQQALENGYFFKNANKNGAFVITALNENPDQFDETGKFNIEEEEVAEGEQETEAPTEADKQPEVQE